MHRPEHCIMLGPLCDLRYLFVGPHRVFCGGVCCIAVTHRKS
jgi:hypothetical protein